MWQMLEPVIVGLVDSDGAATMMLVVEMKFLSN
jgi:hypothetical protein